MKLQGNHRNKRDLNGGLKKRDCMKNARLHGMRHKLKINEEEEERKEANETIKRLREGKL